jgi:hypothetical protein
MTPFHQLVIHTILRTEGQTKMANVQTAEELCKSLEGCQPLIPAVIIPGETNSKITLVETANTETNDRKSYNNLEYTYFKLIPCIGVYTLAMRVPE